MEFQYIRSQPDYHTYGNDECVARHCMMLSYHNTYIHVLGIYQMRRKYDHE